MTAPMIAVLDNDSSFLSLMRDLLTEEGARTLRSHSSASEDAGMPLWGSRSTCLSSISGWVGSGAIV